MTPTATYRLGTDGVRLMRQDTDIARMAAALRTPSLKYRSFGNEPVRNPLPSTRPPEDPAFSILGDALSGVSELSPDVVMAHPAGPVPHPTDTPVLPVPVLPAPVMSAAPAFVAPPPATPAGASYPVAPDPYAALNRVPLASPVPPPRPMPLPPLSPPEPAGQSLLQVLLGSQAPPPRPVPVVPTGSLPPPPTAASAPVEPPPPPPTVVPLPVAPPPPAPVNAGAAGVVPIAALAPVAAAPVAAPSPPPAAPPLPMLAGLNLGPSSVAPVRMGGSTGSSLLDALMGIGAPDGAASIHYPLLDALGDAMRGTAEEASFRQWPAARVDIALPELLRRVASGVRLARSAA